MILRPCLLAVVLLAVYADANTVFSRFLSFPSSRSGRNAGLNSAPALPLTLPEGLRSLANIRQSDKTPPMFSFQEDRDSDDSASIIDKLAGDLLREVMNEEPYQELSELPRSGQEDPRIFGDDIAPISIRRSSNRPREIQEFGTKMAGATADFDDAPLPQLEYENPAPAVMSEADLERDAVKTEDNVRFAARQTDSSAVTGSGNDLTGGETTESTGADSVSDPFSDPFGDTVPDSGVDNDGILPPTGDDEVRCIPKVMQVEETVYDRAIKCHHSYQEKCHMTYITDYHSTTEKKCETTFKKNCHITFKPMPFNETVNVCHTPVVRSCGAEAVGPDICNTHYETNCETKYKTHEVEQDEPVCTMEVMKKCEPVTLELPSGSGADEPGTNPIPLDDLPPPTPDQFPFRQSRQFTSSGTDTTGNGVPTTITVDEKCEDWPVQKCTLEKKLVKKVSPETACRKIPREVCAPNNCQMTKGEEICRDETRIQVQNVPQEECELQPEETCHMEAVLVPRLVPKPNCVKVPKEICVNTKKNPRRVKKPVVKEWCYRPSDLKEEAAANRMANSF